jgi:hypothetical protein
LEDGVIRLVPAAVISEAKLEYLTTPELRSLLTEAAASQSVVRFDGRGDPRDEKCRARVNELLLLTDCG